ncbi:hypothetical protein EUGRSUZ_G00318 [Eucalyptus grandis]|uniref:Uncharacterized protein n=2 Tax=Eucalyptus grandis TaxID=71139 RepID=A0A059B9C5_EUCGR|nr:hypothetical protein EUGRSUZ_G00318 [Eucalyptus grandis]
MWQAACMENHDFTWSTIGTSTFMIHPPCHGTMHHGRRHMSTRSASRNRLYVLMNGIGIACQVINLTLSKSYHILNLP